MKNLTKISLSSLLTYALVAAPTVSAAWGDTDDYQPEGTPTDLEATVMNITNYILTFIALIAILVIIYGGVIYLTAMGSDDKVNQAKKTISAGIIGLVIAGLAYAIVVLVTTLLV